jgi:hypothetical protein
MNTFYGTKKVNAKPMTKGEYTDLRDFTVAMNEDPTEAGYLVEYLDGFRGNHPNFEGYLSWSPKEVFELSYQPISAMNFGHALECLKNGQRVARAGWNGKSMFLFLVPGSTFLVNRPPLLGIYPEGTPINYHAHIDMKTADGTVVPWLASQTDVLANDWMVVS